MMNEIKNWTDQDSNAISNFLPGIEDSFTNQSHFILNYRSKQYVQALNGTLDQSKIMVAITLEDIANRYLEIIASPDNIPESSLIGSGFLLPIQVLLGRNKLQNDPDLRVKVGLPTYDSLKEHGSEPLVWYFKNISKFNSSVAEFYQNNLD